MKPIPRRRMILFVIPCMAQRLILAGLALVACRWGTAETFEWSVSPGAGGLRTPQGWSYLALGLEASGAGGRKEVTVTTHGTLEAITSWSLDLPAGSARRYFLYVQSPGGDCEVSAGPAGGLSRSISLAASEEAQGVLEVGQSTGVDRALADFFARTPYGRADWSALPDNPAGYDGTQWLIVSGEDETEEMTHGQFQALRTWVATGGKLMVFVGRGGKLPSPQLRDLLSSARLELSSKTEEVELSSLWQFLVRSSQPPRTLVVPVKASGLSIRWQERNVTVSATASLGLGIIGLCGLHPSVLENSVLSRPGFWEFLGGMKLRPPEFGTEGAGSLVKRDPPWLLESMGSLLVPGQAAIPIGSLWVILYLLAYLGAVGPLQAWLMRRKTPYAVSFLILLATVSVFLTVGQALLRLRRGQVMWQKEVSVVTIADDGAARARHFSTFIVPSNSSMSLSLPSDVLVSPLFPEGGSTWVSGRRSRWECKYGVDSVQARYQLHQWDIRGVMTAWWCPGGGAFEVLRGPEGISPKLRRAIVLTASGAYPLDEADLESEVELSRKPPPMTHEQLADQGTGAYQPGKDHSAKEIEDVLLALCVGKPRWVLECDLRETLEFERGRGILVGFSDFPYVRPKLSLSPGHHTRVCLVRKMVKIKWK